ncbi:MAG: tRNA pseudouridine(13) synthase TruD, partial [Sulfolobaceae archaeon]
MEVYYREDWDEIKDARIPRPEGFEVIEEVNDKPCTEWKGERLGKYAVFLLTKRSAEHFYVIQELSKLLQNRVHSIGIKDTNAITHQLVYVITNGEEPKVKEYVHNNFQIKFLGFSNKKFYHNGNTFIINIETSQIDEIKRRIKELSKDPFLPSFIGYQRFGTVRPTTHLVGKMILERRWCEALDLVLSFPYFSESEIMRKFRKLVSERKYE